MRRRDVLRAGAGVGTAALAGCLGFEARSASSPPPVVENRPDAVYLPTHVEGMEMAAMTTQGRYKVGLMYSYAHRFWTVGQDGDSLSTSLVEIGDTDVHLMARVADAETDRILPDVGVDIEITKDGDLVSQETIYQMLSQKMGYHHGANFGLEGDGTYTVNVSIGGMGIRRMGDFAGEFGDAATVPLEFEYSRSARDEISFRTLDDAGAEGAVEAMNMDMLPNATVPPAEELPGTLLGTATSGDAAFAASVLDADGPYLAVHAATPYNRFVIPNMALSASAGSFEGELTPALHPEWGYHYGASLAEEPDGATITVELPPFVARHEGYETAFLDMGEMTVG
jgi:hypothetical protein